eukprot:787145-Rhodomonas_salina.1
MSSRHMPQRLSLPGLPALPLTPPLPKNVGVGVGAQECGCSRMWVSLVSRARGAASRAPCVLPYGHLAPHGRARDHRSISAPAPGLRAVLVQQRVHICARHAPLSHPERTPRYEASVLNTPSHRSAPHRIAPHSTAQHSIRCHVIRAIESGSSAVASLSLSLCAHTRKPSCTEHNPPQSAPTSCKKRTESRRQERGDTTKQRGGNRREVRGRGGRKRREVRGGGDKRE